MSIRFKTVLGVAAIEAILLCFLVWNGLTFLRDSNTGQLDKRARTMAELFATATKSDIITLDLATLESQVELLAWEQGVVFAQVGSASHGVLAQRGEAGGLPEGASRAKSVIEENGVVLGWVEVGLTDESIAQTLKAARQNALAAGGSGMLLSALFSLVLGFYLTRQLSNLAKASEEIAAGNFRHRVPVTSSDELGKVATAFNHMSEELDRSYAGMEERIQARTAELAQARDALVQEVGERKQAHREVSLVLSAISSVLVGVDNHGRVSMWNDAATMLLGISEDQSLNKEFAALPLPWEGGRVLEGLEQCRADRQPLKINNLAYKRANGKDGFLMVGLSPIFDEQGDLEGVLLLASDITDFRELESQLAQGQKLQSIGQLAAGIAHEINTPAQYVGNNLLFIRDAFVDMAAVLAAFRALLGAAKSGPVPEEMTRALEQTLVERDLDFLEEEAPNAIAQASEGVARIATIVNSIKQFAHPGPAAMASADLNAAIHSTVVVSRNEWKYVAELEEDLDPDLPQAYCMISEINQVVLNLIINAAHAIGDAIKVDPQRRGRITVRTRASGSWVEIQVADNGAGIPAEVRPRVFDPFFTTKEVGKGTGQGLAIARSIIVEKHKGRISFETQPGEGTTFSVLLPSATH